MWLSSQLWHRHGPDGRSFIVDDPYSTKASLHVELKDLNEAIIQTLAHPEQLEKERTLIAEAELGLSAGDPISNILKVIKNDFKTKNLSIV